MEFGQSDNDVHTTEGAAKAYVNMFTLDHVRPLLEKKPRLTNMFQTGWNQKYLMCKGNPRTRGNLAWWIIYIYIPRSPDVHFFQPSPKMIKILIDSYFRICGFMAKKYISGDPTCKRFQHLLFPSHHHPSHGHGSALPKRHPKTWMERLWNHVIYFIWSLLWDHLKLTHQICSIIFSAIPCVAGWDIFEVYVNKHFEQELAG